MKMIMNTEMTKEEFESNENLKLYSDTLGKYIELHGNIDLSKKENQNKLYDFLKQI